MPEKEKAEFPLSPNLPQTPALKIWLEDVRDALTRGDALLLTQSSARLRECARSFGLHALADLAYLLEESARDSDFEAVRMIMPDLDQLVDRELIRASGKDDAESRPIKNALMF